ncbi:ketosamine-3-kinase-like [Octopus sinensis]|uniref:protein-ribulosamine 3-kinase n=1 Tax=Octopus sinensis TaxID=2607531 RepID=A0A7E6FTN3_9MOLL|nr:ketosamine-3-kinase-like [Octopus sinensis]
MQIDGLETLTHLTASSLSVSVIFDPASFYGHSEFEFSISKMFGGFPRSFFDSYHEIIPRSSKFKLRERLYQLFHYINHWNHFGGGYQDSSMSTLKGLIKIFQHRFCSKYIRKVPE